jgi:imidazolonepropionase-like amidohydrolase
MKLRLPLSLLGAVCVAVPARAQTAPTVGLRDNTPGIHALTGARVVVGPGTVLENATVVIRDGVIHAVGARLTPPADARVWDLAGRTLYAGFLDPYADVGMPSRPGDETGRGPEPWSGQIRAHVDAATQFAATDSQRIRALRAQGITVAMTVPRVGLFRGQAAAVSLGDGPARDLVLRSGIAQVVALWREQSAGAGYPTSHMGAIAFIRQTLHDADWYGRAHAAWERNPAGLRRPETNAALAALGPALRGNLPVLFEARTEEEVLRALRLAGEFSLTAWIRGSGAEYRLLDALEGTRAPFILPVNFPAAPGVDRPETALAVSLADLRHWHLAPENPARMARAGFGFALTADGLANARDFLPNVRKAVARGLAPETALAALTTTPARYLGLERTHGTLETGKVANLVVVEGDLFDDGATIRDVWVNGRRYEISAPAPVDPRGRWIVAGGDGIEAQLTLEGTPARLTGTFTAHGRDVRLSSAVLRGEARRLVLSMPGAAIGREGLVRLTATVAGNELHGWGDLPDGQRFAWRAERAAQVTGAGSSNGNDDGNGGAAGRSTAPAALALADLRPAMEYGRERLPDQPEVVLVRNATLWTMGPQGVIENGDLLVRRGRVAQVGRGLQAPAGALVIDASGKHVTPGLIDAHLHSGITGGVNETGNAIVPEVRLSDVLTITNIWMYRQLAGGLTAAHVMHGSANPIGGQNVHVKMRWGALPDALRIEGAPRTVKFALGENVKRRTDRYPDTRMGTEQIIRDHFLQARDYQRAWREWDRNPRGIPPRRDLRMEALVDILEGRILVQAHSYRQDEILMLMRLAEEFDFRIKAFQHTLEAFKVAPELAAHGAGAVVWSDWGGFKIEAYDNTTWNARILHEAGVLTSLHSDNSQIASRMNWEAAKMLRTGMSEVDALALVTLNPARLVGVDDRIGSLEAGKDADFVIWRAHPLSTFTVAEQTWVDGRKYFDLDEDRRLRDAIARERAELIRLVMDERSAQGGAR